MHVRPPFLLLVRWTVNQRLRELVFEGAGSERVVCVRVRADDVLYLQVLLLNQLRELRRVLPGVDYGCHLRLRGGEQVPVRDAQTSLRELEHWSGVIT